jgi:ATP-binding cassette subfamily B protein/subfamily B ATP-binding cassette protein MsbA
MTALFGAAADATLIARLRQHRTEVCYLGLVAVLFALGTGTLVWIGTLEVQAGRLTVGSLWVFLAYLAQLYEPLNQLGHLGGTVSQARAGVSRVMEVLNDTQTVTGTHLLTAAEARGDLEFEDVTFSYLTERPVLRGLTLRIPAGATVALVGPSGAGKSTLLQVVSRFLEPDAGRVRLGGRDLRDLDGSARSRC